jgi:hypothetical protein
MEKQMVKTSPTSRKILKFLNMMIAVFMIGHTEKWGKSVSVYSSALERGNIWGGGHELTNSSLLPSLK